MCCEDVKIDYHKYSNGRVVNLTLGSTEVIAPDPHRWSILVSHPSAGTGWLVPDQPAVIGQGFQLTGGLLPIYLDREMVGSLIGKAWYCIHSSGGQTIYIAETLILPGGPCGEPNKK